MLAECLRALRASAGGAVSLCVRMGGSRSSEETYDMCVQKLVDTAASSETSETISLGDL